MLKLSIKVLAFVATVFFLLFIAMWAFHGFATKPQHTYYDPNRSLVVSHETDNKLQEFLTDPALSPVIYRCIPAYNAAFRRLNPTQKDLHDLIEPEDFRLHKIIQVNAETSEREINEIQVGKIMAFLNDIDHPLAAPALLEQCMGEDGLDDYRRLKGKLSAFVKSYKGLD